MVVVLIFYVGCILTTLIQGLFSNVTAGYCQKNLAPVFGLYKYVSKLNGKLK